jgi:hypothetical protein
MTMKSHLLKRFALLAASLAAVLPLAAHAQLLPYGDVSGATGGDGDDIENGDDGEAEGDSPRSFRRGKATYVTPYIEAQQVVSAELSPGSDVLTWSTLAAGIDAGIARRNTQGALSLRYERRFGWGGGTSDSDALSGIARASTAIVPQVLTIEGGAMAARMSVENNGAAVSGQSFGDSVSQIYSLYAGPTLQTHMGDVGVEGHYRIGYSRVEEPDAIALAPGQPRIDLFDDSIVHNAAVHFGTKPGEPLPVGLGVGAGWNREDVSNLDQRIDDKHVRGDVAVPLGSDLQLVGGVGYEDVKISSRDALLDSVTGLPVIGSGGRYVTDKSQPRQIAYEADGLIWDAGVLWRPSKRTALEAHVGKRYGSTSYYGSFAYAPNKATSINVSVYDNVTSLGGMLTTGLAGLPTEFAAVRNPLNGDLGTCVAASGSVGSQQSTCLTGALGSIRSAAFRGRGVMATLGVTRSALQYGVGVGYDRRRFIAAPGTVLAVANGVVDKNIWAAAYLNGRIDRNSSFGTTYWANWYQSGDALSGDVSSLGATAAYYRSITSRLTATAAVGVQGVNRDQLQDVWSAQAMAGVRYSF